MEKNKPVGDKANKRHIAFAEEYLANGMNGTQAYKKIYPNASEDTARANATKLLTNTSIKEYIEGKKETVRKVLEDKHNVLEELKIDNQIKRLQLENIKLDNELLSYNLKIKILECIEVDSKKAKKLINEFVKILGDDLYFMYSKTLNLVKIGRSINPYDRIVAIRKELQLDDIEILKVVYNEGYNESPLHRRFKDDNVRFEMNGKNNTEWFTLTDEIKNYIEYGE